MEEKPSANENYEQAFQRDEKREILVQMLKNLSTLPWKKFDVNLGSWLAHTKIVSKESLLLNDEDQDIILHYVDNFIA